MEIIGKTLEKIIVVCFFAILLKNILIKGHISFSTAIVLFSLFINFLTIRIQNKIDEKIKGGLICLN